MSECIRVLMVTRERESDRKYGLGKSLVPVMAALERQGVECGYLNQDMAGPRGWALLRKLHGILTRPLAAIFRGTQVDALLWGIFERFNIGRLATLVASREGWTHLHCHDPLIGFGVLLSRPFSSAKFRWGITEHGFGSYAQAMHEDGARLGSHVMRWMRRLEARILFRADWVIFPTRAAREQAVRDLSFPTVPANWYVIPHSRPDIVTLPRAEARDRLSLSKNSLVVLAVGRLVPLKGFDLLIRAFANTVPGDARLVILGEGDQVPYRDLAHSLGVGERVQFAVTNDVGPYYSAADIYVSTSMTESFGMANLEAMVAGLPGIYSAAGGVTEVVAHGGILIPAGDLRALEMSLRRLAADAGMRLLLGRDARERGQGWIDAATVASAYRECYSGIAPSLHLVTTPDVVHLPEYTTIFTPPDVLSLQGDISVLVIAPHADDETIGCGGTISLLHEAGAAVSICVLSDGRLGDPSGFLDGEDVVQIREAEAKRAVACLGIADIEFLGLADGGLAAEPELEKAIARAIASRRPDWLFIPALVDDHADHVAAGRAAIEAARASGHILRVFMYEVWTPLPINRVVDISRVAQKKRNALECYVLPLKYVDYSGAVEGLMRYRGLSLPKGHGLAEAFLEVTGSWGELLADQLYRIQQVRYRV